MLRGLGQSRHINQRNFKFAVAIAGVLAIAGFFAFEFRSLRAPKVKIFAPAADVAVREDVYEVRGRTDPDADVTLNGRPLYSGGTGEFSERIVLFKGVNTLEFEAKNRYGRTTRLVRYIVVE